MVEDVKTDLVRLRLLENQLLSTQQQMLTLESVLLDVNAAKISLEDFEGLKKDAPAFVPLGFGIFADGVLEKKDKVLVDIGAGIIIEKSIKDATKFLDEKEKEGLGGFQDLQARLADLEQKYVNLSSKIKK